MAGFFSRLKGKDGSKGRKKGANDPANQADAKPKWDDAWTRKTVEPEEIHELVRCCTIELKARALDLPFLLLPFRPTSDPSAVRTFIRHFFDQSQPVRGETLLQELRMAEPMVISGVAKWCWSRLQGGVVGWDAYELFKVGEFDSNMARDSFKTFIPISVENGAKQRIIFDFFELLAAIAAHGKSNGMGGRKLSRLAAWWAFEQKDTGNGFEGGYNSWTSAADATSHLFFAYLRSLAPQQKVTGITLLPMSLQKLLQETEYPPQTPDLLMSSTNRVVMIVENVSPTPFSLLRRANHFQYRDSDRGLQEFSEYDDPVQALTEECKRVLKAVSAANQSQVSSSKHSTSLRDASWSRFEDIGFSSTLEDDDDDDDLALAKKPQGLRTAPASGTDMGRPTTPSWADFLSSGFVDDNQTRPNLLLPPDKVLPPIDTQNRQHSSQSHRPRLESGRDLEPGELASITLFDLDDSFWWVWMSSLAPEETPERKSAFGRCAVIETRIRGSRWLVMEEMVAGAAPEPKDGAYIAEKKGFFSWTRRGRTLNRNKSLGKQSSDKDGMGSSASKTSIGPDTHARIQAKAAQLRAAGNQDKNRVAPQRRGRSDADIMGDKTNSVLTMQSNLVGEASSAMKWVKKYDKGSIKDAYMANNNAGRGVALSPVPTEDTNGHSEPIREEEPEPEPVPEVPTKEIPPQRKPVAIPEDTKVAEPKSTSPPPPPPPEKTAGNGTDPTEAHAEEIDEELESAPKQVTLAEALRDSAVSPEPAAVSPESKKAHNKLHKEKEKGGLRKLFSRKNRTSRLPDNAASDVNTMIRQDQQTSEPPVQQAPVPAATPSPDVTQQAEPGVETKPMPALPEEVSPVTSNGSPQVPAEPVAKDAASVHESLSRVDTRDAAEAKQEFSRFDQGPLADQPAFVPDDDDDEGDATPPPIARRPPPAPVERAQNAPKEEHLSQSAGPGVQDRWAQIRKNAAERAARERDTTEATRGIQPKPAEGGDDPNGEETIESRVARIKARVAELTGNMETSNAPQGSQNGSPVRR